MSAESKPFDQKEIGRDSRAVSSKDAIVYLRECLVSGEYPSFHSLPPSILIKRQNLRFAIDGDPESSFNKKGMAYHWRQNASFSIFDTCQALSQNHSKEGIEWSCAIVLDVEENDLKFGPFLAGDERSVLTATPTRKTNGQRLNTVGFIHSHMDSASFSFQDLNAMISAKINQSFIIYPDSQSEDRLIVDLLVLTREAVSPLRPNIGPSLTRQLAEVKRRELNGYDTGAHHRLLAKIFDEQGVGFYSNYGSENQTLLKRVNVV